jgi:hypothetical protein
MAAAWAGRENALGLTDSEHVCYPEDQVDVHQARAAACCSVLRRAAACCGVLRAPWCATARGRAGAMR